MRSARGVSWDLSRVSEREDRILFSGFASRTDRKRWGARSTRESIVIAVRGTSGSFSAVRCGNIYTALSAYATRCMRVRAAVTRVYVYTIHAAHVDDSLQRPTGRCGARNAVIIQRLRLPARKASRPSRLINMWADMRGNCSVSARAAPTRVNWFVKIEKKKIGTRERAARRE